VITILRGLLAILFVLPLVAKAADDSLGSGWCRYEWDENQPPPPRLNLPQWVCESSQVKKTAEKYTPYITINPFFITGDFDGDGKTDIAISIQNNQTKEVGIAILHRGTGALYILGAGTEVKDRGRDLHWFDMWSLYPKGPMKRSPYEKEVPNLVGDALWIAKSESSSVFIYWNGKQYVWYQESD
jgi:hypothetical protein